MFTMAKRNIKLYFRDKSSVFFSLMGVLVIIVLNIFFLTENLTDAFGDVPHIKELVGTWLVAGIVAVATTTTALGALGTMIEDKSRKIYKDFYTSPLKRGSLAGGYILSCMAVGIIMSVISLAVGIGYIVSLGGDVPGGETIAKAIGIIVLAVLANGSFMFFVASLLRTSSAFSAFSTVVGTLIGFLTGIYMPVGNLPDGVQWAVKLFPCSYAASALRTVLMDDLLTETYSNIEEVPTEVLATMPEDAALMTTRTGFEQFMGVNFDFGDYATNLTTAIIVLAVTAAVFCGLSVLTVGRKNK